MINDAVIKSLDVLKTTLEKTGTKLDESIINAIEDNGIAGIKDSLVKMVSTGKMSAMAAYTVGNAMQAVEESLKGTFSDLDEGLADNSKVSRKIINNTFDIADILDDKLGELVSTTRKEELNSLDMNDRDKIKQKNIDKHQEELASLVDRLVSLNSDQLSEILDQSKTLDKMFIASAIGQNRGGGMSSMFGGISAAITGVAAGTGVRRLGSTLKVGIKKIGIIGTGLAFLDDAMRTIADPTMQGNSVISKAIAGAVTGGIGGSVLGNAAKFAVIGSIIPGVGTIFGAVVGAIVGAAASFIDTKKVADWLDVAGKALFSYDTWFGEKGIFSWMYNLPSLVDKKFEKIGKEIYEWAESFALLHVQLATVMKDKIKTFISEPFTVEFWGNIFSKAGDIWGSITSSLGDMLENLKNKILDYLVPESITLFGKELKIRNKSGAPSQINPINVVTRNETTLPNSRFGGAELVDSTAKYLRELDKKEAEARTVREMAIVNQTINSGNRAVVSQNNYSSHPTERSAQALMSNRAFGFGN